MIENLLKKLNEEICMGVDAMISNIKRYTIGTNTDIILKRCEICHVNNLKIQWWPPAGEMKRGITPREQWQTDFSELPKCRQYKYLFVLVDTFSVWQQVFHCCTSQARQVIKALLKENNS